MNEKEKPALSAAAGTVLTQADSRRRSTPIWLVAEGQSGDAALPEATPAQRKWLEAVGFSGAAGKHVLLPAADGALAGVALGTGRAPASGSRDPSLLMLGLLPQLLPAGTYHLASDVPDQTLAAVAWGLGGYRFRRYKSAEDGARPALRVPKGGDGARAHAIAEAVAFGRDLINTPANDMGPAELEDECRRLARRHGAKISAIVGDDLLKRDLGLIHAVGRASPRAPRLIDLTWGRPGAPRLTLVGKGICFDTGGLDLKPASGMLLMKKDMGGAATALAAAHMIMSAGLDVRLRVLVAAAENSVAGNAFRPGDVIRGRSGISVEIGNTDAEGRLVLADALAVADEDEPDDLMTFATLTGAARVALGPDLPPFYTDDDTLAAAIAEAGAAVGDPVWRLPFASAYEPWLDSGVADMNNVAEGGFAGSIVAALFLKRFVRKARRFAHFDIFGWRPAAKPLGPKGGEPHAARAIFELMLRRLQG